MVMTIGIQGCMNQTSQSRNLAVPRPQKSAKKHENKTIFIFLTAVGCQTAGRKASGSTSADPAWDGQ